MMSVYVVGSAAAGTAFLSRVNCHLSRCTGAALIGIAVLLSAQPAWADQTIMAADSSQVDCQASAKDLTRISLVEDEFASVCQSSTCNTTDDLLVVNAPRRGDSHLPFSARNDPPSVSEEESIGGK